MLWLLRVLVCIHTQFACQSHLGRTGNLSLTNNHCLTFPFYYFSSRGTLISPSVFPCFNLCDRNPKQWSPSQGGLVCQAPQPGGGPLLTCPVLLGAVSHRNVTSEFCHQEIVTAKFYCLKTRCFISETICLLLNPKHFLRHFHKIWWPISCQRGDFFICFCSPLRSPSLTSAATAEGGRNAFVFGLENDNFSRLF